MKGKRTILVTTLEHVLHFVHESRHVGSMVLVWSLVLDDFVYDLVGS